MTQAPAEVRQRARDLIDQVDSAPRQALEEATALLALMESDGDTEVQAILERVRGTSLRLLGDLAAAESALLSAIEHAKAAPSPVLLGEALMSLGVVQAFTGRPDASMASFDEAEGMLDGVEAARVVFQRSSILYRHGDYHAALELMNDALPWFEEANDVRHIAHTLSNRGVVIGYAGDISQAKADLERADGLYRQANLHSAAAVTTHNLGWLAGRNGELARALQLFDQAADELDALGRPHPELAIDRCEVLIAAGCPDEAIAIATDAADALCTAGNTLEGAEAYLMSANAHLWNEDGASARIAASEAHRLFAAHDRSVWVAAAEALSLHASWKSGDFSADQLTALVAVAADLENRNQHAAAREAFLLAGRAALDLGKTTDGERLLERVAEARSYGPISTRVQAWLALALLQLSRKDLLGAAYASAAGASALTDAQAALGALDLRATMATHGAGIFQIGMDLAIRAAEPARIFAWAERARAGALRFPPVMPPNDAAFADELTRLRLASITVRELQANGQPSAAAVREQKALEDRVLRQNRRSARLSNEDTVARRSATEVRGELGERALVEFVSHGRIQHALVLTQQDCRLVELGEAGTSSGLLEALERRLRRLAVRKTAATNTLDASIEEVIEQITRTLVDPLDAGDDVIVVPDTELRAVPWGLVGSMRQMRMTVAPSAALWFAAQQRASVELEQARVVVVEGPGVDAGIGEFASVASRYEHVVELEGSEAKVANVLQSLEDADIAHVIAHGSTTRQNPLFTSLTLADGPLFAYDLQRLGSPPSMVVLSSCNVGRGTQMSPGETLGMASVLLAAGTRNVVATSSLLPDTIDTAQAMTRFHEQFAVGKPARVALEAAAPTSRAFTFDCLGAG